MDPAGDTDVANHTRGMQVYVCWLYSQLQQQTVRNELSLLTPTELSYSSLHAETL
jgi:hypothetical protein